MNGISEKKLPAHEGKYQKMIMDSTDTVDADHNWLITLSDVLSLLLVFFIIFFALSRVPGIKKETPIHKEVSPALSAPASTLNPGNSLEKIQKDMRAAVIELSLDDQVMIQGKDREIVITIKENVTFRSGESEILKGSKPLLDTIAEMIKRYTSYLVEIDGHTDDLPINTRRFPSNWELSVARATSVLKYLINVHGLDPSRFAIKGNAEQRPLSPNFTPEQRAQNRRVEIRLKEGYPVGI